MNHPTFLQWNCRGFKVNFNELSLLIQNHCPVALKETQLKVTDKVKIKNYKCITVILKLIEPLKALR